MAWGLLVLGMAGIVLGLRFRVSTLVAATFVTVVACLAYDAATGLFGWRTLLFTLAMIVMLQGTYLLGLLAGVMWRRMKTHHG